MKSKKTVITLRIVLALAMVGIIGAYIYDIYANGTPIRENIFKVLSIACALLGTLVRLSAKRGRRSLDFYEKNYKNELGRAFADEPKLRKKLIGAVRLYNENNFRKAIKILTELLGKADASSDRIPVLLFTALCYSDMGCSPEAVNVYYRMLEIDGRNDRIHSNLGLQLMRLGDTSRALEHYEKAVEYNPDSYFAYVNRGNCYFNQDDYENAEKDALRALEIRGNGKEAASLLAILYALKGDEEAKKKYIRIYVTNGGNGEGLKAAIAHYITATE